MIYFLLQVLFLTVIFSICILIVKFLLLFFCACSLSRCSCTFSLMISASFFLLSHFPSFCCFRFFLRSFSHSLFFFIFFLSFLGCLLTSFLFVCFLFNFSFAIIFLTVSSLMFLWFLLHCFLSVLSSLINFDFSFFLLIPFFRFLLPLAFSQTFFSVFFLCFQPSFVLTFGFFPIFTFFFSTTI